MVFQGPLPYSPTSTRSLGQSRLFLSLFLSFLFPTSVSLSRMFFSCLKLPPIFSILIQIIHLLPLLFASCDNLVGTEPLTLSHLLCMFSLLSCLKMIPHPNDLNLLAGESCGILARSILCLLEAASCPRGSEELITDSFEISSFELWLPSN